MRPAPALFAPLPIEQQSDWGFQIGLAGWRWAGAFADVCLSAAAARDAITERAQRRFDGLLAFAREQSPYYREPYSGLEVARPSLARLPVVTRQARRARV